ncbi:MAG: nitrogen regulation protein NR(II) [Pseudomonadales bacterium]
MRLTVFIMIDSNDILDHLKVAVLVLDQELSVLYLNQTAQSLCGQSLSRSLGASLSTLFDDPHLEETTLRTNLASDQPFTKRETSLLITSKGEKITANYSISPLQDGRVLVEIEPLDRFKQINREDQNRTAQYVTRELIRGLAHEVKNPLGGIRGAAQLLQAELPTEQHEYTTVIVSEVDRLRNLVDRLLGPNKAPSFTQVNVHQILERVIALESAAMETTDCADAAVEFVRKYDPSVPELEADSDQLVQANLNIVRNARAALEATAKPVITVSTSVVHRFTIGKRIHPLAIRIAISDNGPGIPPDIMDQIFFPMITSKANGYGLGLALTQTIVDQHHGIIDCASARGLTTFHIYLPLEQPRHG